VLVEEVVIPVVKDMDTKEKAGMDLVVNLSGQTMWAEEVVGPTLIRGTVVAAVVAEATPAMVKMEPLIRFTLTKIMDEGPQQLSETQCF